MESQTQKQTRKFIGDIPEEEAQIIDAAAKADKRTKISLIRIGAVKYAEKILKNSKPKEEAIPA